jgi:3-oxoacyl-[acyl-carrier-protein] synthase II
MATEGTAAITGVGLLAPFGGGKDVFWNRLREGGSGIKDITLFDASQYDYTKAGEISDFDPQSYLGQKGLRYLSRASRLVMSAAYVCLVDAGIKNRDREFIFYDAKSLGAVIGTTYGSFASICSFDAVSLIDGPQFVSPMAFPNTVMNCHTGYLAIKESIQGPTFTVATGYTASLDALGVAAQYLACSEVKCFVAGGVEELSEELLLFYLKGGLLSENSYIGEGCGICCIERMGDALNRKAKIYGEIVGYGSAFSQDDQGLIKAIDFALEDAALDRGAIDWVVRGINAGERERAMESEVISAHFGPEIRVSDLRSVLGDSYSAGGSFQIIAGLGLLEQGLARNVLATSIDPCGNCSALIVRRHAG